MDFSIMSSINLDMKSPNTEVVYGVQYDSAGIIKAQLLNNGTKWEVPAGVMALVSFKKSDNIGGFYDTTEAGTTAITYDTDRSIIYIDLDVQTMTTAGKVNMEVNFYRDHRRLSTFAFYLMVQEGTLRAGDVTSSAVFRILSYEIGSIADASYLAETVLQEGRAAAAEAIGKANTAISTANTAVSNIPANVTNWLNNHITEGPIIDDSMSVEGAAADAKAVGDTTFRIRSTLPSGQDLNDLIIPGLYRKSDARTWVNYPEELNENTYAPVVAVLFGSNAGAITETTYSHVQIIFTRNRGIFYRAKASSGWDDWKVFAEGQDIENLRIGNFNQQVQSNPFTLGSSRGALQIKRSVLTVQENNVLKLARANTTSTITSYGFATLINGSLARDLTGHQFYVRISGINIPEETSFASLRVLSYNGNEVRGFKTKNISIIPENGICEFILNATDNFDTIYFILVPRENPVEGEYFEIDGFQFIDLTEMFGAGYEPTVSEFTKVYNEFPYAFIDNSVPADKKLYQFIKNADIVSIGGEESGRIKKIIQEIREEWTALRDIDFEKVKDQIEYFPEGNYQGIPYSAEIGRGGDVFYNRNLSTFFSAVNNPTSIMYQPHWSWGSYQSCNYGGVCSTLSGWICSNPIYYGTDELTHYDGFDWYDYNGPKSIRIGDCLLSPIYNETTHVLVVYDIGVHRDSYQTVYIDTIEQTGAGNRDGSVWCRIIRHTVSEFESYLVENGGEYLLGRYKNAVIRDVDPVRYATDVMPDMGDKTYYYANDNIYIYIPIEASTLYYKKKDDVDFLSVALSSLTTETINENIVYDVTDLIIDYDTYILTTNVDNYNKCHITRINAGAVTVSGENVTISGYSSNLTPVWTETIAVEEGEPTSGRRQINFEGYRFWTIRGSKKLIDSDTFTTPLPSSEYGYQVRVYYETGFGQAFCDSEIIWQN